VFLGAPLLSNGTWNAARFKNPQYDKLVAQYVAALDLQTQRSVAGQIETLLLNETPIVYPYWIDGLTASTQSVYGLNPTSIAQIYLNTAYKK
jgi:peptide/nickel transport system substrate-binding protein